VCDILLLDDETGEPVLFEQDWLAGEPLYLPPGTKTVIVAGFEADPFYFLTTPIGLMFEPYSMPLVTMTPVPEPSAWSLAIVALAAMLLRRRR